MCWFCDDIKKFINKSVVVYDDATTNVIKEYSYPDSTVTLKITAGGYRGNSHILTGMRELNDLKYCPNCGEKIEDFDNCASKEDDKISYEIERLKRDVEDLKKVYEEVKKPKSVQFMMYEHLASKAIAKRGFTKRYHDIVNLYERLAKDGIECTITLDDENGICTIYCYGVELEDNSERVNKLFEDVIEEEKNDQ